MTRPASRRSRRPLWLLLAILVLPVAMCAPFVVGFGGFSTPGVGDAVIVELDLEAPVVEGTAAGLQFGEAPLTTRELVRGLLAATRDPRVKALYARVGGRRGGAGTGTATTASPPAAACKLVSLLVRGLGRKRWRRRRRWGQ